MPTPSKPVPTPGQPNTTEDPKIHDLLAELVSILTANVDRNNLADGETTKAKLATDALNAFLKLLVAGDHKLAWGSGNLHIGGVGAGSAVIPHGLGSIPSLIIVVPKGANLAGAYDLPGAANFTAIISSTIGPITLDPDFFWAAIS